MNVGHPSNFARLVSLYGGVIDEKGNMQKLPDLGAIRKDMWAFSVSDKNTREEIKSIYDRYKVVIEPHGAVGAYAYEEYIDETNDRNIGVCLETADPAKFPEVIREVLKIEPEMPSQMKKAMEKEENMEKMNNDYFELKRFLVKRFGK
jgi:threonine synthase